MEAFDNDRAIQSNANDDNLSFDVEPQRRLRAIYINVCESPGKLGHL